MMDIVELVEDFYVTRYEDILMITECPDCAAAIDFTDEVPPEKGEMIYCPGCCMALVIKAVEPLEVTYYNGNDFYGD